MGLVDGLGLGGGGERFARLVTQALDPDRFERTLCVTRWSDGETDPAAQVVLRELADAGVRFIGLARSHRFSLGPWTELYPVIRDQVDVLHGHKFGSNVWAASLGAIARTPVVVAHEQTWSYQGQAIRQVLDKHLIARFSDVFIAVSERDRVRMIEVEKIAPDNLLTLPNAIAPLRPTGRDLNPELRRDGPLVGAVCALRPQKALSVLVEAAELLRVRFPGMRVVIAGEGAERAALEQQIEQRALKDTVLLLGQRNDVADILAALDIGVLSSDYEGTPLAAMEYMAAGLPVVATAVGGVPEVIEDGREGLLVPPRAPDRLAEAIARLIEDPELASEFGERGRRRQLAEFDINAAARRLGDLYESTYLSSTSGGRRAAR